jgi:diguanylate cyclase (GGDEF)-like protein
MLRVATVVARLLVAMSLVALFALGLLERPVQPIGVFGLYWGLAVFALTALAVTAATLWLHIPTRLVLSVALPFDLLASALLLIATHPYQDPMYAWLVALVIIYALALPKRRAHLFSMLVAVTYLAAHYTGFHQIHGPGEAVLLTFKAIALVLLAVFVADGVHRQREREVELESSHEDIESLNRQLQRRLGELNAVSEITEVIHSSLDFDAIGALVLEIIQKVIDVPACSLLVLDKEKAETLFSASAGLADVATARAVDRVVDGTGGTVELESGLFSCLTVLDHGQMMVVFCAEAEQIENMRVEDRLVLQAVASELAVAVENSQLYKLTKRLSITDELTGLYIYRYLQQRLEDEYERARRYDRPLSLLMLDADDFKKFNDSFGHVAGDVALAELGAIVKTTVREIDIPARYGGEEFSVILPETDAAGAFVVAEKVREAIATHKFADADGDRNQQLTVSIGLATYPVHADDREALLRQADDALYTAKHLGRDRVRAAQAFMRPVDDDLVDEAGGPLDAFGGERPA